MDVFALEPRLPTHNSGFFSDELLIPIDLPPAEAGKPSRSFSGTKAIYKKKVFDLHPRELCSLKTVERNFLIHEELHLGFWLNTHTRTCTHTHTGFLCRQCGLSFPENSSAVRKLSSGESPGSGEDTLSTECTRGESRAGEQSTCQLFPRASHAELETSQEPCIPSPCRLLKQATAPASCMMFGS